MKARFTLFRRGETFYCEDTTSGKQTSLRTKDPAEASTLLHAKNEAARQPFLNLRIAQTYLAASDTGLSTRTWKTVMDEFTGTKLGANQIRCKRAMEEKAFDLIRTCKVIETQPEHLLRVLKAGGVSTNNYLRRLHNFALGMNWLSWPILPKKQWPSIQHKEKRGVSREEHRQIVARESSDERRAFYECCWHLGGAQSDMAKLKASDIDWKGNVVSFFRAKTGTVQIIRFGSALAEVLRTLPQSGELFPCLAKMDEKHRASLFQRVCRRLKITGISLHSYRYSWAERARSCGYPERFAQEALGHKSKAVHRAYAKKAHVVIPTLEEYEQTSSNVITYPKAVA